MWTDYKSYINAQRKTRMRKLWKKNEKEILEVINNGWEFSHIDISNKIEDIKDFENTQNQVWEKNHAPHASMLFTNHRKLRGREKS